MLDSPVMAGLVPAIRRGTVPVAMAGTSPAMTGDDWMKRVKSNGRRYYSGKRNRTDTGQ